MADRPGKYPRTITASSTDAMREQLDAEVKRQSTTMADLVRAMVQEAIDAKNWPRVTQGADRTKRR